MKWNHSILEYLSQQSQDSEAIPLLPIVEIAGNQRVLVENHLGVIQYCPEQIGIRVKYGEVAVSGCSLTLRHMTRTKLVITGQIDQVCLHRRNFK